MSLAIFILGVALAALLLIVGIAALAGDQADDCHARGGRIVNDGPPYYVMSGKVMTPIQPTTCEVP